MEVSRRGLILGGACLIAAPAIVRASSLMPVKAIIAPDPVLWKGDVVFWKGMPLVKGWDRETFRMALYDGNTLVPLLQDLCYEAHFKP